VSGTRAEYGFAYHPDALLDLRLLPDEIRERALRDLQRAVRGEAGILRPLDGSLAGLHKVYLDPAAEWRLVVQVRPALAGGPQTQEMFLVAAGPRVGYTVYRDAQLRLGRANDRDRPNQVQAAWARARSPQTRRAQSRTPTQPAADTEQPLPPEQLSEPALSRTAPTRPSR
jgi:hypothetical protein